MARGGGKGKGGNRNQPRDARGRFASTGASSAPKAKTSKPKATAKPKATGGTAAAQSSLKRARGKLATNATPAQKGAVTRAKNRLSQAQAANRRRAVSSGLPSGTISKRRGKPAKPAQTGARNGIRPTGVLNRPVPANSIKSTNRRADRKPPLGLKANAIRTFNPKTPKLGLAQLDRQLIRTIDNFDKGIRSASDAFKKAKPRINKAMRQLERSNAKDIADRLSKSNADRLVSGIVMGEIGGRLGTKAIQRRMQRAADAAARGSKPAAGAREIYGNQLAYMGTGKPKAAKNNLRPGPRNTSGPPKRTRKPRRKK